MKKIAMIMMMALGLFTFVGCSTHLAEEKTYVVEFGIVTNEIAYTTSDMMSDTESDGVSFSDFCTLRDYLRKNTIDGYEVEYDVTFEELKSMLLQISYTEGAKVAEFIKEHGFELLLSYHRDYDDVKVWISVAETDLLMN